MLMRPTINTSFQMSSPAITYEARARVIGPLIIFSEIRPATTIVEVVKLVDAAFLVEIEAVAVL